MLFVVLVVIPQDRAALTVTRARNVIPKPTLRQTAIGSAVLVGVAMVAASILPDDKLLEVGKGLGLAIVMLSLVPLVGYAGQLSLAQLAFGGIGAVVMWKYGGDGNPLALVLAVLVAGAVGAVVALPTLRLKGLYLALVTMAFAILVEKRFLGGIDSFVTGGDEIARIPRLVGFQSDRANFVLLAGAFGAVATLVAALRRGPFGRRLQAMKDSPAACATLGLDLTTTRLQVFALAAAIAGLGGALFAGWRGDLGVNQNDFSLLNGPLAGLPVLLLAVIGGITSVVGPLVGGLLLTGMPMLGQGVPALKDLLNLAPGLVGISLARNPDGAVAQVSEALRERREARRAAAVPSGPSPAPATTVRPEHLGLDHPFTDEEVAHLDDELGLSWGRCDATTA
ncbi:MAG: branched-chain amino acid ABC transporter permease [Acidimicrobiales bacterium]